MTTSDIAAWMASPDPELRRLAVIEFGGAAGTDAAVRLVAALGDPEWRVRKEAVRALGAHPQSAFVLPQLMQAICQGDNVGLRNAALDVVEGLGAVAVDALLTALSTATPQAKKFLVEALSGGDDPRVVSVLIDTSREADVMTAVAAIETLALIGGSAATAALEAHLNAPEALVRMAALEGLNRLEVTLPLASVQALWSDPLVRRVAAAALGRTGRVEAVPLLVDALSERSEHLLRAVVLALMDVTERSDSLRSSVAQALRGAKPAVRQRLSMLLMDPQRGVRDAAVQLLLLLRDDAVLPSLLELMRTGSLTESIEETVRAWGTPLAARALEQVAVTGGQDRAAALELSAIAAQSALDRTDPDAAAKVVVEAVRIALRDAIESDDALVCTAAAHCLGVWAEGSDADALVRAAGRAGEELAMAAGRALEQLAAREPRAVEAALKTTALSGVAGAALTRAVSAARGVDAVTQLHGALSSEDAAIRKAAIEGLGRLPEPGVVEHVAFALADDDLDVQMTAARVLGELRDAEGHAVGAERLLAALSGDAPGVQAAAARALAAMGQVRAIPLLRSLLVHEQSGVVLAAIEALGTLDDDTPADQLDALLRHTDEEVVKQALSAVARSRDRGATGALVTALGHASWDVRRLAAELLASRGDRAVVPVLREARAREQDELVCSAMDAALSELGVD